MKKGKFAILFIWVAFLVSVAVSCQVMIQEPETELKSQEILNKDLPVFGSKSKTGVAAKIKVIPTAIPRVVTVAIPSLQSTGSQTEPEIHTIPDNLISSNQMKWTVERAFSNLTFKNLTNVLPMNDGSGGFIFTEQKGLVYYLSNKRDEQDPHVLLDITGRVSNKHNEEGLLGIALSPNFRTDRSFYIYYSALKPRKSVLSRFVLPDVSILPIDSSMETVIFDIPQPYGNHNGGQLSFGLDGFLYISLGDGGGTGDPEGNAQNLSTLLGSILRIDVTGDLNGQRYKIPDDNPFVNQPNARSEIWAYGLRNPWRFSFDKPTGSLFVGDVGQENIEEVDIITKGKNYGWPVMEGSLCYSPAVGCSSSHLTLPVIEYTRDKGCSVIGGYVYRGTRWPELNGSYIYGDYCSGRIWAVNLKRLLEGVPEPRLLMDSDLYITSFAEDLSGNIYILSQNTGIYRLVSTD